MDFRIILLITGMALSLKVTAQKKQDHDFRSFSYGDNVASNYELTRPVRYNILYTDFTEKYFSKNVLNVLNNSFEIKQSEPTFLLLPERQPLFCGPLDEGLFYSVTSKDIIIGNAIDYFVNDLILDNFLPWRKKMN